MDLKVNITIIFSMDSESLHTKMEKSTKENGLEGTSMGEAKRHGPIKQPNGEYGKTERGNNDIWEVRIKDLDPNLIF
jgi:hypothetical protein